MSKVHVLPPDIISKIAAGEVIDRPSSVVKELLENSLDAKATHIEITIKQAGRSLIQISDNGTGIEHDDLEKVFMRHATSKIETFDDLFAISSLGFRGEALYSIAAVSDLTLRSQTSGQDSGWEIHYRGSEQQSLKPVGMQQGTDIKIQELFYNTPARRKFLKRDATEFNNVMSLVLPYTLMHYSCRFLLSSDYRNAMRAVIDLAPASSRLERITTALNLPQKDIVSFEHDFSARDVQVTAYLGDMNIRRTSKDMQFIFINGRPVYHRLLNYRLNDMYRSLFPRDTYPFFALFLTVPPAQLDLNVHPAKREVKIEKEYDLCTKICALCEETLMAKSKARQVNATPFSLSPTSDVSSSRQSSYTSSTYSRPFLKSQVAEPRNSEYISQATQQLIDPVVMTPASTDLSLKNLLMEARFVGVFHNKYLLFEDRATLLLIDQHAGQERVNYEKLIEQCTSKTVEVQRLLAPVSIQLSRIEMVAWEEAKTALGVLGFETTQWDAESIAVHTHPVLLKDVERSVRNVISDEKITTYDEDTIARAACRRSTMAGDIVDSRGAELLRTNMIKCKDPFTCPHGRPTVIQLTEDFIDKQFLRL